jgi:Putative polyhydroxyalkanoic acid system protein (PHA_gran_rgn)
MKHSLPHSLGLETARKVVRSAFDNYTQRFSDFAPTTSWPSEDQAHVSFSAKGMSINGTVFVRATSIDIDLDVPFLLKPFQGKAVEVLERELGKWVEKAKNGQLT